MNRCSAARAAVVAVNHVTMKSVANADRPGRLWLPTRWAIPAMFGRSGARHTRQPAAAPNSAAAVTATVAAARACRASAVQPGFPDPRQCHRSVSSARARENFKAAIANVASTGSVLCPNGSGSVLAVCVREQRRAVGAEHGITETRRYRFGSARQR